MQLLRACLAPITRPPAADAVAGVAAGAVAVDAAVILSAGDWREQHVNGDLD